MKFNVLIICIFIHFTLLAQHQMEERNVSDGDTLQSEDFQGKYADVNEFTPWNHLKCIYTTGKETYEDGRAGERSEHWWRMSYIGRACEAQHGRKKAVFFEAVFAIPHYIGIGIATGFGRVVYIIRGPKDEKSELVVH